MKVLKAPDTHTRDRITSEGQVHFENGIATEFTKEQGQFFCEKIPGYEIIEIEDAAPPTSPVEAPAVDTAPSPAASETEEKAPVASTEGVSSQYVKVLNRSVKNAKKSVVLTFGKQPNHADLEALLEAERAGRNRVSMIVWLEELLSPAPEEAPPADEEPATAAEESETDLEADPDGQHEETGEEPGTEEAGTEEAVGEEPGAEEVEPVEESPQEGGQEGSKSEAEEIVLPVIQDDIGVIREFAKTHGISVAGSKAQILERIYADERFKK